MAAQPNGMPQNAAMYGMNGNIMPSAGHYADMQTLMQNMESLSGWLEQNRQDWEKIQEGLAQVESLQARNQREGGLPVLPIANGDSTEPPIDPSVPTTIQLQSRLTQAHNRIASLEATCMDQQHVQRAYEETLAEATERIRNYCFDQKNHVIALHQHYTTLLQSSRNETLQAQLQHQQWQGALGRLSEGVRAAYSEREQGIRPWRRRVAALKEENRLLRAKVGWDPPEEWSEEEDEGSVGDEGVAMAEEKRGRAAAAVAAAAAAAVAAQAQPQQEAARQHQEAVQQQ